MNAPNVLPIARRFMSQHQPYLQELQGLIDSARTPGGTSAASSVDDISSRLARLVALHNNGDLSADEFAAAKAQILDPPGR